MTAAAFPARFPAHLIVIVDRAYAASDARWSALLEATARAAEGRPVAIQVRARDLSPAEGGVLAARARAAVPRTVPLLLNGEAALAAALGYDGVHWPEAAIPPGRESPAPGSLPLRWRSAAVHGPQAARRAAGAGADLLVFGAVYTPGSKAGVAAGLDALRAVVAASALPVFALGGVQPERVVECLRAGAAGIATISGVLGAPDLAGAVERYCEALAAAGTVTEGSSA